MATTDFASHHIEGYANAALEAGASNDEAFFNVPLISHIEGNLWMGGATDGLHLDDSFRHVVSLYPWERYDLGPHTVRVEFKMYDSENIASASVISDIADYANFCIDNGKTLVHCQAGLNRSGLITAMALIKRGRTPEEAIALLREKRHELVLCNGAFEEFLQAQV